MRIAAISDIHGNALALQVVQADARERGYDLLVQRGEQHAAHVGKPEETHPHDRQKLADALAACGTARP